MKKPHDAPVGLYGRTLLAPAHRGGLAGELARLVDSHQAVCARFCAAGQTLPFWLFPSHPLRWGSSPSTAAVAVRTYARSPLRAEQSGPFILAVATSALWRLAFPPPASSATSLFCWPLPFELISQLRLLGTRPLRLPLPIFPRAASSAGNDLLYQSQLIFHFSPTWSPSKSSS